MVREIAQPTAYFVAEVTRFEDGCHEQFQLAGRPACPYSPPCRCLCESFMPNLICNIVWMPHYRGEADVHAGGFDYVSINGYGHELLNFDALNGKVNGFVQTKNSTVNITRLGAKFEDAFVDGVRVIFISTHEKLGPVVIGWYENARVWRHMQPGLRSVPTHPDVKIGYQFEASSDTAMLLPVSQREFAVPNRKKGFPGQSPVFFPDESEEMRGWMRKFEKYFDEKNTGQADASKKPGGSGRSSDPERNALVEISAIEAVIAALGPVHRDRQPDNCGWDLEFLKDGTKLCVEVKGNSGVIPRAEVSPNEYRTIKAVMDGLFTEGQYRLAIVTDAFGGRNVHLFGFTADGRWVCERTGVSIKATESTAAIFS